MPRHQLVLCGLGIVAVALAGGRYLKQDGGAPAGSAPAAHAPVRIERSGSGRAVVHVTGAVRRPGVYRIPAWARLDLAVRRAGGAARGADLQGVNLAAKVADGQQVVVPRRGPGGAAMGGEAGGGGASHGPISLN